MDETKNLACPQTQIISSIQQQIPPDQIAARIGEMIQAKQPSESGDLETDWRTVEAGIRLYLDYATKFPTAGRIESPPRPLPEPTTALSEAAAARRETKRNYSPHQPEIIPPRPTVRVLPTKNTDRAALESLENMRKLLILETPLAVLQENPRESLARSRAWLSAEAPLNLPFDQILPDSEVPSNSRKRHLPLMALVASLMIGVIVAGLSQLSAKPLSSNIARPMENIPAQPAPAVPMANQEIADNILNHFKPEEKTLWW